MGYESLCKREVAPIRAYSLASTLCNSLTLGLHVIVIPGPHRAHHAATMTTVMDAAISAKTMEVEGVPGDKVSIEPLSTGPVPSARPLDPTRTGAAAPPVAPRIVDLTESKMMFSTLGLPAPLVQATRAAGLNEPTAIQEIGRAHV